MAPSLNTVIIVSVILVRNKLCLRMLILSLFFSQRTPLHISASLSSPDICRLLLQCKADVGAKDIE
jgi:hypothetical protein